VRKNDCPYAGNTERQRVKELLKTIGASVPDVHANTLNALKNLGDDDKWGNICLNERKPGL
jgi:hypothetical protein